MNFWRLKLLLLSSVIAMVSGCMSPDRKGESSGLVGGTDPDEEARIQKAVEDLGYTGPAEVFEDFVLVEGCYDISKSALLAHGSGVLPKTSQQRNNSLAYQGRVREITVRVHSSVPADGGNDWWWATQQAISDWNSVAQTSVRFVYTTASSADIVVKSDYGELGSGTVAQARVPCSGIFCLCGDYICSERYGTEGDPGNRIRINLTNFRTESQYPWNKKRATMTHELGHAIGLLHTNSTEEKHIEQTPLDSHSVMWTPSNGRSITNWDRISLSALYPNYERLGGAWWDQAIGIASLNGWLYVVHNARLYRVSPTDGSYTQLGGAWWDQAVAITAHGTKLYILHASKLYEIEPSTGAYTQRGGASWNQAVAMTSLGSDLYILHAAKLYRVAPSTGAFIQIGGAWWNQASTITSLGSSLYLVHAGYLYEVSPSTGSYTQKGGPVYTVPPIMMAPRGGFLYIVENSALNRTETNGAYVHGQDAIWSGVKGITSMGDHVYIIQGSHLVKVYKMEV